MINSFRSNIGMEVHTELELLRNDDSYHRLQNGGEHWGTVLLVECFALHC